MDTWPGIYLAIWFLLAIGCGWAAWARGYSAAAGFAASLFLSPLVVLLFLALLPYRERKRRLDDDRHIAAIAETYRRTAKASPHDSQR